MTAYRDEAEAKRVRLEAVEARLVSLDEEKQSLTAERRALVAADAPPRPSPAARYRYVNVAFSLAVAAVAVLGFLWIRSIDREERRAVAPAGAAPPKSDEARARELVPGFPANVDPTVVLSAPVRQAAHADGAAWRVEALEMHYVRADGTMDLDAKAYRAFAVAELATFEPELLDTTIPVGAPRPPRVLGRHVVVRLDRDGLHLGAVGVSYADPILLLPPPRCDVPTVWRRAKVTLPAGSVAKITYEASAFGQPWTLQVEGETPIVASAKDCD